MSEFSSWYGSRYETGLSAEQEIIRQAYEKGRQQGEILTRETRTVPGAVSITYTKGSVPPEYVRHARAYYRKRFCPCPYQPPWSLPKNIHIEYRHGDVVVNYVEPKGEPFHVS